MPTRTKPAWYAHCWMFCLSQFGICPLLVEVLSLGYAHCSTDWSWQRHVYMPIFSCIFIGWFVTCHGVTSRDARKSRVSLVSTHVAWRRSRCRFFVGCPSRHSRLPFKTVIPESLLVCAVIRNIFRFGFYPFASVVQLSKFFNNWWW